MLEKYEEKGYLPEHLVGEYIERENKLINKTFFKVNGEKIEINDIEFNEEDHITLISEDYLLKVEGGPERVEDIKIRFISDKEEVLLSLKENNFKIREEDDFLRHKEN